MTPQPHNQHPQNWQAIRPYLYQLKVILRPFDVWLFIPGLLICAIAASWVFDAIWSLGCGIGLLLLWPVLILWINRTKTRRYAGIQQLTVQEDGIAIITSEYSGTIHWVRFTKVIELNDVFLLFAKGGEKAPYCFERSNLTEEQINWLTSNVRHKKKSTAH